MDRGGWGSETGELSGPQLLQEVITEGAGPTGNELAAHGGMLCRVSRFPYHLAVRSL